MNPSFLGKCLRFPGTSARLRKLVGKDGLHCGRRCDLRGRCLRRQQDLMGDESGEHQHGGTAGERESGA